MSDPVIERAAVPAAGSGTPSFRLSAAEVERYHLEGYLGPYTLCTPDEMAGLRERIVRLLDPDDNAGRLPSMITALNPAMRTGFGRHHDNPFLFELATDAKILDRVTSIMGDDLMLWRTMFFRKEPDGKMIPWHQDYDGWLIEPMLVMSAWLAIDETTAANGCVDLIPGSHRQYYPFVPSSGDVMDGFPQMADPARFDASSAVSMQLKPGEFFLFNERILHRSLANTTGARRLGMSMRYIPPLVRVLDPEDKPILVSGQDRLQFNALAPVPAQ